MNEREAKVVEAALRAFARFGVRRATMNDIAAEVGVARQTLYSVFPTKDDVLRATIRHVADRSVAAIRAEWSDARSLGEKLDIFFSYHSVKPYQQIQAAPDPEDSINGFVAVGQKEITKSNAAYRRAVEEALEPHRPAIERAGLSVRDLADFVQTSAAGYKQTAKSKKQLLQLLETLKVTVLKIAEAV